MNTVIYREYENQLIKLSLSEVMNTEETAFIGKCGNGPQDSLYLIAGSRIVQAKCPRMVWNSPDCPVTIYNFVDVEIKVRRK